MARLVLDPANRAGQDRRSGRRLGKDDFFTFLPPPFAQAYTVRSLGTSMDVNNLLGPSLLHLYLRRTSSGLATLTATAELTSSSSRSPRARFTFPGARAHVAPAEGLSCGVHRPETPDPANSTTIGFDEPEAAATWTNTYAGGSYANCPEHYSSYLSMVAIGGVTFRGTFMLRSNYSWGSCSSPFPDIFAGGALQTVTSTLTIQPAKLPTTVRFSLVVDGTYPDPKFAVELRTTRRESVTVNAATVASKVRLEVVCNKPIATLQLAHPGGPWWVMDNFTY